GFVSNRKPQKGEYIFRDESKHVVDELVDKLIAKYDAIRSAKNGDQTLSDLWKAQMKDRGYLIRRGVPESLLVSEAQEMAQETGDFGSEISLIDASVAPNVIQHMFLFLKQPA